MGITGSSGGSLVATPDCKTADLGSNPAISPAFMGCHLGWHFPVGCPLRGDRGEYKQKGLLFHQKQLRKKKNNNKIKNRWE
jgi:hypothetical protein